jgi:hypothetical protein
MVKQIQHATALITPFLASVDEDTHLLCTFTLVRHTLS